MFVLNERTHVLRADSAFVPLTVFNVPTHRQAAYGLASLPHAIRKHLLRQRIPDQPPPYDDGGYIKRNSKADAITEKERDRVV